MSETINGPYKAEVIHRGDPWRNCEDVEFATLKWVDWFNKQRLLEPMGYIPPPGYIPPIEDEEKYYAALDNNKLAA